MILMCYIRVSTALQSLIESSLPSDITALAVPLRRKSAYAERQRKYILICVSYLLFSQDLYMYTQKEEIILLSQLIHEERFRHTSFTLLIKASCKILPSASRPTSCSGQVEKWTVTLHGPSINRHYLATLFMSSIDNEDDDFETQRKISWPDNWELFFLLFFLCVVFMTHSPNIRCPVTASDDLLLLLLLFLSSSSSAANGSAPEKRS